MGMDRHLPWAVLVPQFTENSLRALLLAEHRGHPLYLPGKCHPLQLGAVCVCWYFRLSAEMNDGQLEFRKLIKAPAIVRAL